MGLLDQLRSESAQESAHNKHQKWSALPELLASAIPEYQHGKVVLIRGEVIVTGSVRNIGLSRHFYAVLHNASTAEDPAGGGFPTYADLPPRPGNARPIAMGVSRYRAESETNYYMWPFVGWAEPTPEALARWIADTLNSTTEESPRLEAKKNR